MRMLFLTTATLLALAAGNSARAVPIHIDAEAAYTGASGNILTMIPLGTPVTADVDFSASAATPPSAYLADVTGSFTWDNGGPQVFNVSSATLGPTSSSGVIGLNFSGSGPTIGSLTIAQFTITVDLGTNPFTTTEEIASLLVNQASVVKMRVGVSAPNSTSFGDLDANVSGLIVPEPSTFALAMFGIAAFGAFAWRRRVG